MAAGYLNTRCKRIVDLIISTNDYISLEQIAAELKLSKRSIYYEICKINEWLEDNKLPELEVTRGKGIRLEKEMKANIENIIEDGDEDDSYVFSPTERVRVIICYIINAQKTIYIEDLCEYCVVSRNTIFNDLRVVVNQLQEYDLKLEYESKIGYIITGDSIRVRALYFLYFNTLHPLFDSGVLKFINKEEIEEHLEKLKCIEKELNTSYVDGILLSLAALIPLMQKNEQQLYFPGLKKEEVTNTKEYHLIEKYFGNLCENEKIYLCLHLLGSRVSVASDDIFDDRANQSVYEMTKALVTEFEKVACVIFDDREELERDLFIHINASLYRYQYGIQVGNPMSEDIIREYPNLYDITKIVCRYLDQQIGLPIPDSEVAYLALHFGAYLQAPEDRDEKLRILIVCVNGISTGNMLKREISQLLPQANIVDVVAASNLINIQNICDVVISTVKIKSLVPSIVVHPILTNFDKRNILKHPFIKGRLGMVDTNALFEIVKKYVSKSNYANLKKDLVEYFKEDIGNFNIPLDKEPRGLCDFLGEQNVLITDGIFKWEQTVRFVGECLVNKGSIEDSYLESIISQIRYYGPYMFITPGVLLAHAKPEEGVHHLDVSMCILKNSVKFSEFHEAKVVIVLAAEDQEKHLKILKDIMSVFAIQARVDELQQMNSAEEVITYLVKILEEN